MTNDVQQTIKRAKEKIQYLDLEVIKLKKEIEELSVWKNNYKNLQSDYNSLKLARTFCQSEEDKKKFYRQFTNMITEIDKCLEMLND